MQMKECCLLTPYDDDISFEDDFYDEHMLSFNMAFNKCFPSM
jgi:hypothetical protein